MAQKTVSEIAALGSVTVRTLHYYDEIGLLSPTERTEAGYRLYTDDDLARLHAVLMWRSLGFPLEEVRELVDNGAEPLEAMLLHRDRLLSELKDTSARIAALDEVIRKRQAPEALTNDDLIALFDGFDPSAFEEEAEQRWGDTDAYAESKRRTAKYSAAQWQAIKAEQEAIEAGFASLLASGRSPDSAEATAAAEAHRAHMTRWFYECTPEIHAGLAEMYTADERFARHYDRRAPGLAAFVRDAILALHAPRQRTL